MKRVSRTEKSKSSKIGEVRQVRNRVEGRERGS